MPKGKERRFARGEAAHIARDGARDAVNRHHRRQEPGPQLLPDGQERNLEQLPEARAERPLPRRAANGDIDLVENAREEVEGRDEEAAERAKGALRAVDGGVADLLKRISMAGDAIQEENRPTVPLLHGSPHLSSLHAQ